VCVRVIRRITRRSQNIVLEDRPQDAGHVCVCGGGAGVRGGLAAGSLAWQHGLHALHMKAASILAYMLSTAGRMNVAPTTLVGADEWTSWVCVRVGVGPYTGRFEALHPRGCVVTKLYNVLRVCPGPCRKRECDRSTR